MPPGALDPDAWLSLQEASDRLGVSRATLRAWADRGRVNTFRTPGGHRRFRERDLAMLAARGQETAAAQPLRVLAHAALGRTRFEVSDGWLANEEWYRRFPAGAREQHRDLGRQVVMALSELISGPDVGRARDPRAEELGKAYGELNRKYKIATGDALRAFLFFRRSFLESLIELAKTSPGLDALTLLRRAGDFVDAMLLAMVTTNEGVKR
jgi:excisionase family DNA binding protein